MKKSLEISMLLVASLMIAACNLDTFPSDKYTVETFWQTEQGAEAAMTGCYNVLASSGLFGDATPLLEETATPNAYNYINKMSFNVIARGTHTSVTTGIISARWEKCYEGIGRCNTHLNRLADAALSDDRKSTMEGETRFLRALYYHMLTTYYGDVPLILEEPEYSHGTMARTKHSEVVKAILDDLDRAIALLDWRWNGADNQGRATKGAAMGLKARVLLYEASPLFNPGNESERWNAAAAAAKELIDNESSSGFGLYPNYRNLFMRENEHNSECVFNIEFSKTKGAPNNKYSQNSVQFRNNAPLLDLVESYETTTGEPQTPGRYDNLDPRFAATIFYPGCLFMGIENASASQICQFTGFAHKKLTIYNGQPEDPDQQNGDTNYMFIRYADILLMYAEAQNEIDGSPSSGVYKVVNRVRSRVGMPPIVDGSKTQSEMRNLIRHERRIEFAGEGLYYNDIRRWKTAETVMNTSIKDYNGKSIAFRQFNPERDYWWPIPEEQLKLNENLVQNPNF